MYPNEVFRNGYRWDASATTPDAFWNKPAECGHSTGASIHMPQNLPDINSCAERRDDHMELQTRSDCKWRPYLTVQKHYIDTAAH